MLDYTPTLDSAPGWLLPLGPRPAGLAGCRQGPDVRSALGDDRPHQRRQRHFSRPCTQLSGSATTGPGPRQLLDYIWAGDTVVVVALDRLGRSLSRVIPTVATLTEAGGLLRSLREGI
jgi:hypothetical protein